MHAVLCGPRGTEQYYQARLHRRLDDRHIRGRDEADVRVPRTLVASRELLDALMPRVPARASATRRLVHRDTWQCRYASWRRPRPISRAPCRTTVLFWLSAVPHAAAVRYGGSPFEILLDGGGVAENRAGTVHLRPIQAVRCDAMQRNAAPLAFVILRNPPYCVRYDCYLRPAFPSRRVASLSVVSV